MGTRSYIGIKTGRNEGEFIYCHWDGYPDYNGKILLENYTDETSVRNLLNLGDISSLGPKLNPDENLPHDLINSQPGVVVAYHRDNNEKFRGARKISLTTRRGEDLWDIDYFYLFDPDKRRWYVAEGNASNMRDLKWVPLDKILNGEM